MKFGSFKLEEAEGAILAHALNTGEKRFRKAHRLSAEDIAYLRSMGVQEVTAALLDATDLDEDAAAGRIAAALRFEHVETRPPGTGRANLHATESGVFVVDREIINAINGIDPAITIATLEPYASVEAGRMVATVKIIPFAVPEHLVAQAENICRSREAFSVQPYRPRRVGLVQTELPGLKPSILDKTVHITEARLSRSASIIVGESRTAHHESAVADAIRKQMQTSDMVIVFGASAVCDDDDVIPAAIRLAGGQVSRVGMPVDPGNLLVMGSIEGKPVIGAPGCARSPKLNGFDWVLDRMIADIEVSPDSVAGMGVGGLLMEIPTRPQLRENGGRKQPVNVWAIMLAAGRSSRMGLGNKLLSDFDGEKLVSRSAARILASKVAGSVAVLGHQAEEVSGALAGLDMKQVRNPDFADGLSSSLKLGIRSLPPSVSGALITLADMPGITTEDLDRMVEAFIKAGGKSIVRATHGGKRGNPVILPRSLFLEVNELEGDTGARQIIEAAPLEIIDVELGPAASLDVDTPEALAAAGGVLNT